MLNRLDIRYVFENGVDDAHLLTTRNSPGVIGDARAYNAGTKSKTTAMYRACETQFQYLQGKNELSADAVAEVRGAYENYCKHVYIPEEITLQ